MSEPDLTMTHNLKISGKNKFHEGKRESHENYFIILIPMGLVPLQKKLNSAPFVLFALLFFCHVQT